MSDVVSLEPSHRFWGGHFKLPILRSLIFSGFIAAGLDIAHGQTIERNPAEIVVGTQVSSLPEEDSALTSDALDDSPLGVDLIGISVVPPSDDSSEGVVSSPGLHVNAMPLLDTVQGRALLEPFLGRPLSQKLIADIRIAITQYYRSQDRALVSVLVPPQEITSGVLRLVVTVFTVDSVMLEGNEWTPSDHILKTVRVRSGEAVDSGELTSDLNWLNLNPYREVGAVFEPGAKPGVTNLTLRARERRPWGVYTGYSNTGSPETGPNRLFVGVNMANLPFIDHQLAYQATFSPNVVSEDGDLFGGVGRPDYMSHSLSYFVPLPWRHKLNLQASFVESNKAPVDPFRDNGRTVILYGDYGIPLPRFNNVLSEFYMGIEYGNQRARTYFGDIAISSSNIDVVQGVFGWRGQRDDRFGWTGFDIRGVLSPGGITSDNTDAAYALFSVDPAASANYAYIYARLSRSMRLFDTDMFDTGLTLDMLATAQLANKALPGLEQFGIGGWNSVRGYETLEASGDDGFTSSVEVRSPQFSLLDRMKLPFDDIATVSTFWDFGYTSGRLADESYNLSGIGLGLDVALGDHLSASVAWGYALTDGPQTDAGDSRIQGQVITRF